MRLVAISPVFLKWAKHNRESFTVLLFFVLLAVIYWYPLPFYLRNKQLETPIIDPAFNQWIIGWGVHALTHYPWRFFEANMFYPFAHTLAWGDHLFAITLTALPLKPIFGLVGTHNLLTILSSAFSGFTMYLLVRYLTKQSAAALFSGVVWGFSYARLGEATHIQALSTQWIPLVFLFAEKIRRETNRWDWLWLALAIFLVFATSYYLALFTVISFVVYQFILLVTKSLSWSAIKRVVFAFFVGGLAALPLYLLSIMIQWRDPIDRGFTNQSAIALNGLLPWPPSGTIIRHAIAWLTDSPIASASNWQSLGLITSGLILIGLIRLGLEWKKWRENVPYIAFLIVAIVAVFGALGPIIFWFGEAIIDQNRIHTFFYNYIPSYEVLRIPSRWFLLALFGFAIFAGWASIPILNRLTRLQQGIIIMLCTVWIVIEQFPVPHKLHDNFSQADYPVYAWLQEQKDEFPILELPIYPGSSNHGNDIIEARRMYFSTFHWKKRVSGAISPYVPRSYIQNAELLNALGDDPQAIQFLIEHDVRYVLFFPKDMITLKMKDEDVLAVSQRLDQTAGLEKIKVFPEATVYAVKEVN